MGNHSLLGNKYHTLATLQALCKGFGIAIKQSPCYQGAYKLMRETKCKHINSQLISMLAFGTTEENDPVHTLVRPCENHQTDSCRTGCPDGRQNGQVQFPDEKSRLIQDHLVSSLGQCSLDITTKLRVASRGLCLSILSALGRGGQLPSSHSSPSAFHWAFFLLQIFVGRLLCARPHDGPALMGMGI